MTNICITEGCTRQRGGTNRRCNAHYLRLRRYGDENMGGRFRGIPVEEREVPLEKVCKDCAEMRAIEEYGVQATTYDGRKIICNKCMVERNRWSNIKRLYGLTKEAYLDLLKEQGGVCAICLGTNPNGFMLSVDHNHTTGAIRALLCNPCNLMIGNAREAVEVLIAGAEYLERFADSW